jgi:twinkle protein
MSEKNSNYNHNVGQGEFLAHFPCPHCGSSDAYSVYTTGEGKCYACDAFDPKAKDLEGEVIDIESVDADASNSSVTPDYDKQQGLLGMGKIQPLKTRRINQATCRKFGYNITTFNGSPVHVAPYYDESKNLVAQHIRYPDKSFRWLGDSKKVQLFGQHLWPTGGRKITICEGEIDCMSLSQAWDGKWPVVSIPSGVKSAKKYLRKHFEFLDSYNEIILAFDDDEPGREAVEECALLFKPGKVKIMQYDGHKDTNELLVSSGPGKVMNCFYNAQVYRPDGILDADDLWDTIKKEPEQGFDLPYPVYSEMVHGIRLNEIHLLTAGSGMGKTTMAREIAYHLKMKHNQPIGLIELEDSESKSIRSYLSIYLNTPIALSNNGKDIKEIQEAYTAFMYNAKGEQAVFPYKHFGSTEIDNLLAKIRYMIVGYGVKFLVLDHISIVVSGLEAKEGERKLIDVLMTKLRTMIEELGAGLLAIVHLKRPKDGTPYTEGRKVALSDLRGSGSLEQLSDVVVALERNQQGDNPHEAVVRILKNRPLGITGIADKLQYNDKTGRLLPIGKGYNEDGESFEDELKTGDSKQVNSDEPPFEPDF